MLPSFGFEVALEIVAIHRGQYGHGLKSGRCFSRIASELHDQRSEALLCVGVRCIRYYERNSVSVYFAGAFGPLALADERRFLIIAALHGKNMWLCRELRALHLGYNARQAHSPRCVAVRRINRIPRNPPAPSTDSSNQLGTLHS